jgi:hypothetical protein
MTQFSFVNVIKITKKKTILFNFAIKETGNAINLTHEKLIWLRYFNTYGNTVDQDLNHCSDPDLELEVPGFGSSWKSTRIWIQNFGNSDPNPDSTFNTNSSRSSGTGT